MESCTKMSEFGHILDDGEDFSKLRVRNMASNYFSNPVMTKVRSTERGDSMFAARFSASVNKPRYLLCLVEGTHMVVGQKLLLDQINWYSLQTRQIDDEIDCEPFVYQPRGCAPFNSPILLLERTKDMTTYENRELDFRIALIHVDSKSDFEYPDAGTFATALETYQSLLLV